MAEETLIKEACKLQRKYVVHERKGTCMKQHLKHIKNDEFSHNPNKNCNSCHCDQLPNPGGRKDETELL